MTKCNVNVRSEEHTSELQSHLNLVCRLLLAKKRNTSLYTPSRHPHLTPHYTHRTHARTHTHTLPTTTPAHTTHTHIRSFFFKQTADHRNLPPSHTHPPSH